MLLLTSIKLRLKMASKLGIYCAACPTTDHLAALKAGNLLSVYAFPSMSLQTYGPGGLNPLLPGPQDNSKISLGIDAVQVTNPREQSYVVLAVRSPSDQAVDLSGWNVTAGSTTWKIPEGGFVVSRVAASVQTPSSLGVCFQHSWQPTGSPESH